MTKRAIIGTHARKGTSKSPTYWKQDCGLDESKMADIKVIGTAYLDDIDLAKCFHSEGFVRTEATVKALTGLDSTPCIQLSPYGSFTDSEWEKNDPQADKLVSKLMVEHPDFFKKVGQIGAQFIRNEIGNTDDGNVLLFMSHRSVAEPIVANLLNQWPLVVPVTDFGQGDLTVIEFDGDTIVGFGYLAASKAAALVAAHEENKREFARTEGSPHD